MTRTAVALCLWIVATVTCTVGTAMAAEGAAQDAPVGKVSAATEECLGCHASLHPGIVEGWKKSRHARRTPAQGLAEPALRRRLSADKVPQELSGTVVGCAECHLLRPGAHGDTFEHNGYKVHIVVTPDDCATCHTEERQQFDQNLMSHAHDNLMRNPLYMELVRASAGVPQPAAKVNGGLEFAQPSELTNADACLSCHGTTLKVTGKQTRQTVMGDMDFPVLDGWPSSGVGRVNPDGSLGSCSACHNRHDFSIKTARTPDTCKQCHVGPDVPVNKIYEASRHGKVYKATGQNWNMEAVPWTVGTDFLAPTCASCHVSLVVDTDGQVLSRRSHRMTDRLPWRLFGLIYAHPHPKDADVTPIRNKDGHPAPTALDGTPASAFLIDSAEQGKRRATMLKSCLSCHGPDWVDGYWKRFENTLQTTNQATLAATRIMQQGWKAGLADPKNHFDEYPERVWADTWLFYANSTRMASAMGCGGDYGVFADGRHQLMRNISQLDAWLRSQGRR